MQVSGKQIRIDGLLIRTARLAAEGFEFLEDPEAAPSALRESAVHINLLTLTQHLPHNPLPRDSVHCTAGGRDL